MPDPLYRIKPLHWRLFTTISSARWVATNEATGIVYAINEKDWTVRIDRPRHPWRWLEGFETREAAQAAADEHNLQQMMPGLEEVT